METINVGNIRNTLTIAYVVIPTNADREVYVTKCLRSGKVSVLTENNEIISDVDCSADILSEIKFPTVASELGTCIGLLNLLPHNKPIAICRLLKNDESAVNNQYQFADLRTSLKGEVSLAGDSKSVTLSIATSSDIPNLSRIIIRALNKSDSGGEIELSSSNNIRATSKQIELDCDVKFSVVVQDVSSNGGKTSLSYESGVGLEYSDEFGNKISLSKEGFVLYSDKIKLGEQSEQNLVLGKTLQSELNKNKVRLTTLLRAVQQAPVVAGDGGASFKAFIVSAISSLIEEDYTQILSDKNFTQ